MSSPYRLSDAERDEAIQALSDAYVDGRLGREEFDARMETASRAVLATDLDPLFADLPPRPVRAVEQSPRPAARRRRGPPPQIFALLPIAVVLAAVSLGAWWMLFAIPFFVGFVGRSFGARQFGPHPYWMGPQRCRSAQRHRGW